jgi:GNAT superfamily N-acetyltransferase
MWRAAEILDDPAVVALGLALYAEDPSEPVPESSFRRTLEMFRGSPWRGGTVVLALDGKVVGYAFLVAYWSNELGGDVCAIDELYVAPAARSRGWGSRLIEALAAGSPLWPGGAVALALGVSPGNHRARALYERLGFAGKNVSLARRRATPP